MVSMGARGPGSRDPGPSATGQRGGLTARARLAQPPEGLGVRLGTQDA
jgi:hypothetical protein